MSELIERQAAIDAIHCNIVVTGRENAELVAKTMGEFVDRIKALPTIQPEVLACGNGELVATPEPQWIPVSERLPEESEYCIITANDGVGHRTTFAKFQKKAKSWDLTGARSYWRVIAWMPLPEPYGKEDLRDEQT